MSQSCHCEAPRWPWQSRRTVLNFRKISANSKHFTRDSHVASLLGMTKRRLFAIPMIPRRFPLVFPPKPSAGLVFRHPDAKTKCTARQAGRSACQKVPSGLLPSCLQNCKTYFVVLFCNFAAAAGYLTRKDTLTVPLYYRVVVFIAPIQGLCYTVRDAVDWFRFPTARRFLKGSNHSPLQYC